MPQTIGAQSARVAFARDLLSHKGRAEHRAFAFEGKTMLGEALRSGIAIRELFVTADGYDADPRIAVLDREGMPVYLVGDRTFAKVSDVETPTGILGIADLRFAPLDDILARGGITLLLADLGDPGNVGTLIRTAEAFGAAGVVLGSEGVDPYHPKVVRAAMGSLFRLNVAVADPLAWAAASSAAGTRTVGLAAGGSPLDEFAWPHRAALVVGHERRGLGRWEGACEKRAGIRMAGATESLNAASAGAVALYAATLGSLASRRKTL